MDNADVVELLDRVRELVVRSIEAQEHEQHEVAARLLVEARVKIDTLKKTLNDFCGTRRLLLISACLGRRDSRSPIADDHLHKLGPHSTSLTRYGLHTPSFLL